MNISLRHATPQDASAVAEVLYESRRAFLPFAAIAHEPAAFLGWVEEHLIPRTQVHVAVVAEQVVGVLAQSRHDGASWVEQLYVRPGFTGHGVGSRLLALAHGSLAPPIRLYTFQANAGARRFYERHGYRPVAFSDGAGNQEKCPDVLYEWSGDSPAA